MNGKSMVKWILVALLAIWSSSFKLQAQLPLPPDPFYQLNAWYFLAPDWVSTAGDGPLSFTNVNNPPSFDGNALQVDSTNAAWMQYAIEDPYATNINFIYGAVEMWVLPDWNSGIGPGDWGRLIEVGAYSTNNPSSWWSLYLSPDGSRLNFSSETNGVFTNYLSVPIAWDTNDWNYICLTYSHVRSELYTNGVLAATGPGVFYTPSTAAFTNGFFVGSDMTGTEQSRASINDLATYNYAISVYEISNDYAVGLQWINGGGFHTDTGSSGPLPPGFSGGGTNGVEPHGETYTPDYGTNLWLEVTGITNTMVYLRLSNTVAAVEYQIWAISDLTQTNWVEEGFIDGSAVTNWTDTAISAFYPTSNLFLRACTVPDDGTGLSLAWELQYFGTNGVDPNADPAGDGWSNIQKYQNGMNPTNFYTPPAPQGVNVAYNTGTDEAVVSWQPSAGPVTGYVITDSDGNTINVSASTFSAIDDISSDTPDPFSGDIGTTISVQAKYGTNFSAKAGPFPVETAAILASIVPGPPGTAYLSVAGLPADTAAIRLTEIDSAIVAYYDTDPTVTNFDIPVGIFTNGLFQMANSAIVPDGYSRHLYPYAWRAQAVGPSGNGLSTVTPVDFDFTSSADGWTTCWLVPPFVDGRIQMKQNLIFQLRAALADGPFQYSEYNTNSVDWDHPYFFTSPTNYAFASYLYYNNEYANNFVVSLDAFQPFIENYFDRNFIFNGDYDDTGRIITGVDDRDTQFLSGGGYRSDFVDAVDFQVPYFDNLPMFAGGYQFAVSSATNFPAVLYTNDTRWLANSPLDGSTNDWARFGVSYNSADGSLSLAANVSNWFGLPFVSVEIATNGPLLTTLEAGYSTTASGYLYPETAQPQLGIVEYDYWPFGASPFHDFAQSSDFPGFGGMHVNHTNSVLLTAVGNAGFQLACFAKLAVTNGYPDAYGFLQQYFERAYQIDTNGFVTTNETGVLSPYGQFLATQPGPVALVTMPDVDTGERGTCTVYAVSLQLDKNHDGVMDTSMAGPDTTSQASPFVFWCNNNFDRWAFDSLSYTDDMDDVAPGTTDEQNLEPFVPDYDYRDVAGNRIIPCTRDLEDFARLWACGFTEQLLTNLPSGSQFSLSWGDVGSPNTNNPTIDVFQAADGLGGIGYLTNEDSADSQIDPSSHYYYGRLAPGSSIQMPAYQLGFGYTGGHFIWCGVTNGTGQLTLTITDGHSNVIVQTSAYIQIEDVKQLYERWTVGDLASIPPLATAGIAKGGVATNLDGFQFPHPQDTNTTYILHVHGYNMEAAEKDRFAETAFKRLYWQGYQGRFGEFRWPTTVQGLRNLFNAFNLSETNAWSSAAALYNLITNLDAEYSGNVYLTAHSHGNVVAGEALNRAGSQKIVKTYLAMQAAIAAHAYDSTTPDRYTPYYPDYYGQYWPNGGLPYFTNSAGARKYVNFLNTNDWALTFPWPHNQDLKPASGFLYGSDGSGTNFYMGDGDFHTLLVLPADRYTIFSYCDPAPSLALGAQTNVGGAFLVGSSYNQVELDLPPYSFGKLHLYHSGEFRSDNAQRWLFWDQALFQMGIKEEP